MGIVVFFSLLAYTQRINVSYCNMPRSSNRQRGRGNSKVNVFLIGLLSPFILVIIFTARWFVTL